MLELLGSKKNLEIIKLLGQKDRYVSEIMDKAKIDGKKAKYLLERLESQKIIKSYKKGTRKCYTLTKDIKNIIP